MTEIDVVIDDEAWRDAMPDVEAIAARCLAEAAAREPRLNGAVALLLTDDARQQDLNRQFRGFDTPTNVLSFPSGDGVSGQLGDISIAFGVATHEAAIHGATLSHYFTHLLTHGVLHLVGYDHNADDEAEIMEAAESAILDALGVYNPYAGEESNRP